MMTFQVRLKMARKPNQPRLRFAHEKLRNPDVACTFQATIGGKFAPLIGLSDEDMDMDTMITTYNTAVTDAASEILGKERHRKKPWVTKDVLDLCDERRDLKKKKKEILSRWTEYCSELYNYESCGDNAVLDCSQPPEEDLQPILREEVEIAVASLKKGKSAGVDNIPAELFQAGGETMIDV